MNDKGSSLDFNLIPLQPVDVQNCLSETVLYRSAKCQIYQLTCGISFGVLIVTLERK